METESHLHTTEEMLVGEYQPVLKIFPTHTDPVLLELVENRVSEALGG